MWREKAASGAVAAAERGGEWRGGAELRRGCCCLLRVGGSERTEASGEKRGAGGSLSEASGRWDPQERHPAGGAGVRSPRGGHRLSVVGTRCAARGALEGGRARPGRHAGLGRKGGGGPVKREMKI